VKIKLGGGNYADLRTEPAMQVQESHAAQRAKEDGVMWAWGSNVRVLSSPFLFFVSYNGEKRKQY
jgi:hypothetical protein